MIPSITTQKDYKPVEPGTEHPTQYL